MKYIEAPHEAEPHDITGYTTLFIAGGITGCPDWQKSFCDRFSDTDLTVFNPKRVDFDTSDPKNSIQQIEWEYQALLHSDIVAFWFPCETLCPITLYELGAALNRRIFSSISYTHQVVVGMHPEYKRRLDLEIQVPLTRKDVPIVYSLDDLEKEVRRLL